MLRLELGTHYATTPDFFCTYCRHNIPYEAEFHFQKVPNSQNRAGEEYAIVCNRCASSLRQNAERLKIPVLEIFLPSQLRAIHVSEAKLEV